MSCHRSRAPVSRHRYSVNLHFQPHIHQNPPKWENANMKCVNRRTLWAHICSDKMSELFIFCLSLSFPPRWSSKNRILKVLVSWRAQRITGDSRFIYIQRLLDPTDSKPRRSIFYGLAPPILLLFKNKPNFPKTLVSFTPFPDLSG